MKIFYGNVLFLCCVAVYVGCAGNKVSNDKNIDYSALVNLHKEMNEKHGKTSSYFASIALANEDYDKAYGLYYNECKMGSVIACLNTYYIGEERALTAYDSVAFARDLESSVEKSLAACRNNESIGCVNAFFAFDTLNDDVTFITNVTSLALEGQNNDSIMDKALNLTKKECQNDDATSCFLYSRMLRNIDNYADVDFYINKELDLGYVLAPFVNLPTQSPQSIAYFQRACTLDEALSCNYLAYWFDKYERDSKRAKEFYQKACNLGINNACLDTKKSSKTKELDEVGAPVLNKR